MLPPGACSRSEPLLLVPPAQAYWVGEGRDSELGVEEEFKHKMFCSLAEDMGGKSLSSWVWATQLDTQKLL